MNLILDTHYAFWSIFNSKKISKEVRSLIEDKNNDIYVSAISIWEISIKHLKNPKAMEVSGERFYKECLNNGFYILPLQAKTICDYERLVLKDDSYINNDPFDRMLVAQAKYYQYTLVTHDHCMKYYLEPFILVM